MNYAAQPAGTAAPQALINRGEDPDLIGLICIHQNGYIGSNQQWRYDDRDRWRQRGHRDSAPTEAASSLLKSLLPCFNQAR